MGPRKEIGKDYRSTTISSFALIGAVDGIARIGNAKTGWFRSGVQFAWVVPMISSHKGILHLFRRYSQITTVLMAGSRGISFRDSLR